MQCDVKDFLFIERLLAAQNPLAQADRPHQLFADAPPAPVAAAPAAAAAVMPPAVMAVPVPSSMPSAPNMPPSGPPMPPVPPGMPPPGKLSLSCVLCFFNSVYGKTELVQVARILIMQENLHLIVLFTCENDRQIIGDCLFSPIIQVKKDKAISC